MIFRLIVIFLLLQSFGLADQIVLLRPREELVAASCEEKVGQFSSTDKTVQISVSRIGSDLIIGSKSSSVLFKRKDCFVSQVVVSKSLTAALIHRGNPNRHSAIGILICRSIQGMTYSRFIDSDSLKTVDQQIFSFSRLLKFEKNALSVTVGAHKEGELGGYYHARVDLVEYRKPTKDELK